MSSLIGYYEGTEYTLGSLPDIEKTVRSIDVANELLFKNAKLKEATGTLAIT